MKKISIVLIGVISFSSIAYSAEKELNRKGSTNSNEGTPRTPVPKRMLNNGIPQLSKTPTSSAQNSPKQGRPAGSMTSSGAETPKKKVTSMKALQSELKRSQELSGSGEVKK